MNRAFLSALAASLSIVAFGAPPVAIISSVPAAANNVVPGQSGATWTTSAATRAFDSFRISPNGQNWVAIGRVEAGTTDEDILVIGTGWDIASITTAARENTATPWGFNFDDIQNSGGVAINDAGLVVLGGDDTNATTTLDGFLATVTGGVVSRVIAEGDVAVGDVPAGSFYFGSFNSVNVDASGKLYYHTTTGTTSGAGRRTQYVDNTVLFRAQQTPITDLGGNVTTFSTLTDGSFGVSDNGASSVFAATLTAPSSATCLMVNGSMVLQRNVIIAGSGFTEAVNLINANVRSSSNGNYITHGSNVAVGGATVDWVYANGQVIAKTDDPITPGNTLLWDDTASANLFFSVTINNLGETVVGGFTSEPDNTKDVKFVCNGRVIVSEGDEVDMDGNGSGDGLFISVFNDGNHALDDNLFYTFTARLKDGSGTDVGNALLRMKLPLPGDINSDDEVGPADFALLAAAFGSFVGDPNYDANADLNGDGEVGPADFAILSANFGRLR